MSGGRIGFYSGDITTLSNDIQELRPTLFVTVPRLLNKMYDKVCFIMIIIIILILLRLNL